MCSRGSSSTQGPSSTATCTTTPRGSAPALATPCGGKKVGRANELLKPDEVIEQVDSRTIAASPLFYNVKLEDVDLFFSIWQDFGVTCRLPGFACWLLMKHIAYQNEAMISRSSTSSCIQLREIMAPLF
ncbi:la protein 1-like [Phragmites australis]|uniref:la protein 1-like n=1 Tax=Phragmites australis TaxID=29695 RepID=UPI002D787786|nr:la protein 1-like [Phragmites australis]XP_062194648.1 la protein 1-like [Phragmites australis]